MKTLLLALAACLSFSLPTSAADFGPLVCTDYALAYSTAAKNHRLLAVAIGLPQWRQEFAGYTLCRVPASHRYQAKGRTVRLTDQPGFRNAGMVLVNPATGLVTASLPRGCCTPLGIAAFMRSPKDAPRDALAEVNAQRAARGLRPFTYDAGLTKGAMAVAKYRAERLISGHVHGGGGDFGFLPTGVHAPVAGCAAWARHDEFGACELYSNYRRCGAAWAIGPDGRRYCHAFYRD